MSRFPLWTFLWAVLLTPSSLGFSHKTPGKTITGAGIPAWRIDLRSVGFTGFAPKKEQWGLHLSPNPLCFADNNSLIATFITREEVTSLAHRDQPSEALPLRLHGVFLSADAGKVKTTTEWSITRARGGIIAAGGGKFVVLTPSMVSLYSAERELVKDFQLSAEQQSHLWDFHVSPTGKSILVDYHYPEAKYQWLDSDTLQPQSASFSESLPVHSISDDKEISSVRDTHVASGPNIFEALIQPKDRPERTVCRARAGPGDICGNPGFLSNDLLAFQGNHELSVGPKTGGTAILTASFRDDEWLGLPLYPSSDGKRFAVTIWAYKGGSAIFDISSHRILKRIVVYDLPSRQAVYNLEAKQQKIKDVSGVALSPDGSLLAILTDGVVEVYQLSSNRIDHR